MSNYSEDWKSFIFRDKTNQPPSQQWSSKPVTGLHTTYGHMITSYLITEYIIMFNVIVELLKKPS